MDVTLSLNNGALNGESGFMGSRWLCEAFLVRGHSLNVVNPEDVYLADGGVVRASNVYHLADSRGGRFHRLSKDLSLEGDVFFVYGLGEDSHDPFVPGRFMDSLYNLERQYGNMFNSAEATSYEDKKKQSCFLRDGGFPFIPTFDVRNNDDLFGLVSSGEKIIAKPNVGFLGRGVLYFDENENVDFPGNFGNYTFQRFVPSDDERRYLFIDGGLMLRRRVERPGPPGKETYGGVELVEGDSKEEGISREIMSRTGMFYGSVDFRGSGESYVLEVNGSGTGVAPPDDGGLMDCYNLSGQIVKSVERKVV